MHTILSLHINVKYVLFRYSASPSDETATFLKAIEYISCTNAAERKKAVKESIPIDVAHISLITGIVLLIMAVATYCLVNEWQRRKNT
jgi:uncharacterized membrane protein